MAYYRISELTPGSMPVSGTALLEISVSDNTSSSGYDSYQITVDGLFTDRTLVGTPRAATAMPGTATTQIASTAFVMTAVAGLRSAVAELEERLAWIEQALAK